MAKFKIITTTKFQKDLKVIKKRGLNLELLTKVINMLSEGKKLPDNYHDHSLQGNYVNYRECHIKPDWLLIYRKDNDNLILTLTRTGTHSDVF